MNHILVLNPCKAYLGYQILVNSHHIVAVTEHDENGEFFPAEDSNAKPDYCKVWLEVPSRDGKNFIVVRQTYNEIFRLLSTVQITQPLMNGNGERAIYPHA